MTHKFQTNFRTLFEACPSKRWLNSVWTWVELRATGALAAESWGRLFVRWLLLDPAISTAMTVSSVADGMHNAVRGGPNGLDHAHRGQTVVRAGQDGRGVQVTRSGIAQSQTEGEEYELEAGRVAHLINFFHSEDRTGQDILTSLNILKRFWLLKNFWNAKLKVELVEKLPKDGLMAGWMWCLVFITQPPKPRSPSNRATLVRYSKPKSLFEILADAECSGFPELRWVTGCSCPPTENCITNAMVMPWNTHRKRSTKKINLRKLRNFLGK